MQVQDNPVLLPNPAEPVWGRPVTETEYARRIGDAVYGAGAVNPYFGTADPYVVADRRAKNKRARAARKINRGR